MIWKRVILSWMTLLTLVFASAGATGATDVSPKTHVGAIDLVPGIGIEASGLASADGHQGNWDAVTTETSDVPHAARGAGAIIEPGKLGYLLGQAGGRAHNVARTAQNAAQLSRIGVHNNATGRALLQTHFEGVAANGSNVASSFSNQYGNFVVKESLFSGPGGFLKFQSTWQVLKDGALKLTTAIPFGG